MAASIVALPSSARSYAHPPRLGNKVSIILTEQLDNLGHSGEEVKVTPGYARNYLIPQGKAVYATELHRNTKKVVLPEAESRIIAQQREVNMLKTRIGAVTLKFSRATTDGVTLYSAVTPADVVESLNASFLRKLAIKEKNIRFASEDSAIKTVGDHTVEIEPRTGLWCKLTVTVESS